MKEEYTIKELSEAFKVSTRTIERYLKNLLNVRKNKTYIPLDVVNLLKHRHNIDTTPTDDDSEEPPYDRIEAFTNEDYNEFFKRLSEYPLLKEQNEALKEDIQYHKNRIEYHEKSLKNHLEQQSITLNLLQQRNFIEAKDKGFHE